MTEEAERTKSHREWIAKMQAKQMRKRIGGAR